MLINQIFVCSVNFEAIHIVSRTPKLFSSSCTRPQKFEKPVPVPSSSRPGSVIVPFRPEDELERGPS